MAAAKKTRIQPRNRAKSDLEEQREERKFTENDSLQLWWAKIVDDPRFRHVRRAVERRMKFKGGVQNTPHGQHVADGYRQGFSGALNTLESLPFSAQPKAADDSLEQEQTQDPDLNDGRPDPADRRFG